MTDQAATSRAALDAVRAFLGGPDSDGDRWTFQFGDQVESNWGAVYGGALAAGCLAVARSVAPDRSPRSLHIQIVRSLALGAAHATAEVRHAGRTVGTVQVELYDARQKLAAIALVTMVNPSALARDFDNSTTEPFDLRQRQVELLEGFTAPVQRSLGMLIDEKEGVFTTNYAVNLPPCIDGTMPPVNHITLPWDDVAVTGPEAACLGADAVTAPPTMYSYIPNEFIGPNPDLSLRFTTAPAEREVFTAGTLLAVHEGTVTVGIEALSGGTMLGHGVATGLLLAREQTESS